MSNNNENEDDDDNNISNFVKMVERRDFVM